MKDIVGFSIWLNIVLLATLIVVGEANRRLKDEISFLKCQQQYEQPAPPTLVE